MKADFIYYSNRCWVGGRLQPATISIAGGKISGISFEQLPKATDVGKDIIMPAVIDAHVHINEPGRTHWEGFKTATAAAAAGGTGTLIDMPLNATPVTTTVAALNMKLAAAKKLSVHTGFYGGVVPGNVNQLQELARAGVFGFKCFLTHSGIDDFPNVTVDDLDEAMPVIAATGLPLLVHCELDDSVSAAALKHYPTRYNAYLQSRPGHWEEKAIALMIDLCRRHQCPVHIVHVSFAESIPLIAAAKAEGLPVTAETCPHYLFFSAEEIKDKSTLHKCAPPIRNKANNQQLKKALKDGVLDFIATDHSPAPPDIKQLDTGDFKKAWGGIAGLQFLLTSAFTALHQDISMEQFIPLVTENPALFLGLQHRKGYLKPGYDADLVIWDPGAKMLVEKEQVYHRHSFTPYLGYELQGNVRQTIINGEIAFTNLKHTNIKAGQCLLRK